MASENTHRAQGEPCRTRSLRGGNGRGAKAAGKATKARGTLRHEGKFLGTYTISEDGKKLTVWLLSKPEDGWTDGHPGAPEAMETSLRKEGDETRARKI